LVALVSAVLNWRLAWTDAWPRMVPIIQFAQLSHMLMNGFLFNHGFDMSRLLQPRGDIRSALRAAMRAPSWTRSRDVAFTLGNMSSCSSLT
jgi:hypothetical protein